MPAVFFKGELIDRLISLGYLGVQSDKLFRNSTQVESSEVFCREILSVLQARPINAASESDTQRYVLCSWSSLSTLLQSQSMG